MKFKQTNSVALNYAAYGFVLMTFLIFSACHKTDSLKPLQNAAVSSNESQSNAASSPNIVIILADDVGYDAIGVNGNGTFQTPNINQMAQDGMRFTHTYGSPLCSPSRTAFISGKYSFRNYYEWGVFDPNSKAFANLAKTAGYATFAAGKWSYDLGDYNAHRMGFDDYSLWDAVKADRPGNHYKDPKVYEYGNYLSDAETKGKYGDDIFTSRVLNFISAHKTNKFLVYFPITLCHSPYSPTPDDPEFPTWDPKHPDDTSFFPNMMAYLDKKVGEVRDSLKAWNLYNNTIFIFAGDNGTPNHIFYLYNGVLTEGTKAETTTGGIRVPLFVTWPNKIAGGQVNRNLIKFQDFLPTLAEAMGVPVTSDYGTIDGVSFYPQLTGSSSKGQDWIYNYYDPHTNAGNNKIKVWTQDTTYKLYYGTGKFYNINVDPKETNPLRNRDLTNAEKDLRKKYLKIMDSLQQQVIYP